MIPDLNGFGSGHYLKGLCNAGLPSIDNYIIGGAKVKGLKTYAVPSMSEALPWARWGDMPSQTMRWLTDFTETLERVIETHSIDVINVHHTGYPMLPGTLCKKRYGLPLVLTVHGSCFLELDDTVTKYSSSISVAQIFQDLTIEADTMIVLSESQRQEVLKRYRNTSISLVSPGIDRCFTDKPFLNPNDSKQYFFYAGRIAQSKGVLDLIDIFQSTTNPLLLAGPVQDIDISLLNAPNIRYIGNLTQDELFKYYSAAYATIIPSVWKEPFGLVATESLSCGTPVIAYRSGALGEIINLNNGILCDSKQELTQAIFLCY
ncbi:MAG: glycosyltransferase family 4 protein [Chloroflexaceae bacterium]|nr:glycosyltransferase family 4 protein [Chloroflexaceae bacterium]